MSNEEYRTWKEKRIGAEKSKQLKFPPLSGNQK
jgi:hypothetical protein